MNYHDAPDAVKGTVPNNRLYSLVRSVKPVLKDNTVVSRFLVEAKVYYALVDECIRCVDTTVVTPENLDIMKRLCGVDDSFKAAVMESKAVFNEQKLVYSVKHDNTAIEGKIYTPTQRAEVVRLLEGVYESRTLVISIKYLRAATGEGLKEAKEACESIRYEEGITR